MISAVADQTTATANKKMWTIRRRVACGLAAMILIFAGTGIYCYARLLAIKRQSHRIVQESLAGIEAAGKIDGLVREIYALTLKHSLTEDADKAGEILARIRADLEAINRAIENYEPLALDSSQQRLLQELKSARQPYAAASVNVLMADPAKLKERMAMVETELEPAYQKLQATVRAIDSAQTRLGKTAGEAVLLAVRSSQNGILVGQFGSLFASVAVGFFLIWRLGHALGGIVAGVQQSTDGVAKAVNQFTLSSQMLCGHASSQAASLEETSASLEEIASMTRRNSTDAQTSKELASQTRSAADAGLNDVRELTSAMDEIESASENISKIIRTIDEIAFQTNILALNAAVEAARAGEAGLGFAVVADEVRNLSQRSAFAAQETAEKIENSIQKSRRGSQISAKVAQRLEAIAAQARQLDALAAKIATASQEQSEGVSQVNVAVTQISQVTQFNAATANETANATFALEAQIAALQTALVRLQMLAGRATSTDGAAVPTKASIPSDQREPMDPSLDSSGATSLSSPSDDAARNAFPAPNLNQGRKRESHPLEA